MVVYGDLLFLINFSMDFLCFYLSCLLLHRKLNTFRCVLASVVGGIYSVSALFIQTGGIGAFAIDLAVLVLMCALAYGVRKNEIWRFLKSIFLYFFVSALLGGMMTALFSLFNSMNVLSGVVNIDEEIDVGIFILLAVVCSVLTLRGGKVFRTSFSKKVFTLEIKNENDTIELHTLVDSGNLAAEPISGKSVAFVSVEKCKKIIDNNLYNAIINNSYMDDISLTIKYKIRMVPARAISGETFIPAVKFPRVTLKSGKTKRELDIYIALVSKNLLGEYDAIISDETII